MIALELPARFEPFAEDRTGFTQSGRRAAHLPTCPQGFEAGTGVAPFPMKPGNECLYGRLIEMRAGSRLQPGDDVVKGKRLSIWSAVDGRQVGLNDGNDLRPHRDLSPLKSSRVPLSIHSFMMMSDRFSHASIAERHLHQQSAEIRMMLHSFEIVFRIPPFFRQQVFRKTERPDVAQIGGKRDILNLLAR